MLNSIDYSISKFVSFADDEILALIQKHSKRIKYKNGDTIETKGTPVNHMFLIESGLVQLGLHGADGTQFNLMRLGAGHTFSEIAFFLNVPALHDAQAIGDVDILKLSRRNIDELMQLSPGFSKALMSVACQRVQTTLSYIGDSLGMTLEGRTAKQILTISQSANNSNILHLRQVDLAHSLGVSRVSIGKAIKSLSSQGLIKIGYGKLEILSRPKLIQLAKKNTRYF